MDILFAVDSAQANFSLITYEGAQHQRDAANDKCYQEKGVEES